MNMPGSRLTYHTGMEHMSRRLANCSLGQVDFEPDVPMITLAPSETRSVSMIK